MDQVSTTAPMVEAVTDVGPDVVQVDDITVVPAVVGYVDGERAPAVIVQIDGSRNQTMEPYSVKVAFSIEQWVELQLRGEETAHQALLAQELLP